MIGSTARRRLLMGVVHLAASPSRAATDHALDAPFEAVVEAALADARALREGGCDALMVENFCDAPFHRGTPDDPVPPDVPAALAVAARAVRLETGLPVGVNCLRNDTCAALGAAAVAGARFVRANVWTGAMLTDQGRIDGQAAHAHAYRRQLSLPAGLTILADLLVKHAVPLAPVDPATAARDLAERSGAGGLVVSGDRTGAPVDAILLADVREAVGDFPVWLGSGLSPATAPSLWPLCDGAIVGTWVKRQGRVHEPVDASRVATLRQALDRCVP